MITLTPRSTLFPYTTLFRSRVVRQLGRFGGRRRASGLPCHALDVCFTPMADNAALAKLTLARLSLSAPTVTPYSVLATRKPTSLATGPPIPRKAERDK